MIRESFVGRDEELQVLRRVLLGKPSQAVIISGSEGVGKTALAYAFSYLHEKDFIGGISRLHANSMETLDHIVSRAFIEKSACSLVIIDDVHQRPSEKINQEILGVRDKLPNSSFIFTTSASSENISANVREIQLGGLHRYYILKLLDVHFSLAEESNFSEQLIDLFGSNLGALARAAFAMNMHGMAPRELLARLHNFSSSGIFDSKGYPLQDQKKKSKIISDITIVSDTFLKKLHDNPSMLYKLSPRNFEEVIAEIFHQKGYDITLTPASRDGGKDIYAAMKSDLGAFLYVVECKRFAPDNIVGVGLVRQLNGVVEAEKATAGILVTTSFFSKGAREFQSTIANRMSLKDYIGIQEWLSALVKKRT